MLRRGTVIHRTLDPPLGPPWGAQGAFHQVEAALDAQVAQRLVLGRHQLAQRLDLATWRLRACQGGRPYGAIAAPVFYRF